MNATKIIESKKAAFVTEYVELCKKYDMAVIMSPGDYDKEYSAFGVVILNGHDDKLDQMKIEMLLERASILP